MPDADSGISEQTIPPRRGRPPGTPQSKEAREKISAARQEQERLARAKKNTAPLPSTFAPLSEAMRAAITDRDGRKCRSCGDAEPDLRVHTFLNGLDDLGAIERDPELHAVMCSFCRKVADDLEARSVGALLRERW